MSVQESWALPGSSGQATIRALVERADALDVTSLGGVPVVARLSGRDAVRRHVDGRTEALGWAPSDLLVIELTGGQRAMLRPSGTEPKLKLYFDARAEPRVGESIVDARARAQAAARAIRDDLVEHLGGAPLS